MNEQVYIIFIYVVFMKLELDLIKFILNNKLINIYNWWRLNFYN